MEIEKEKKLNFLDLSLEHPFDKIVFNIFRKPTYTDVIIPFCSAHPLNIKKSAFFSMLHTIYSIVENNGYNIEMVDDILRKVQRKKTMDKIYSPVDQTKPQTFKKIRFLPNLPHKLLTEFKRSSMSPAFYNRFNVKNNNVNNKVDKRNPFEETGVYKFECELCDKIYIGQTGRSFVTRIKEHMAHIKNDQPIA
jgi:hypothetical protein